MKKIYNQFLILFAITTMIISCNAQILPLNTDYDVIPLNAYLKDLNNELDPYVGNYQSIIDGNQITLYITKEEHKYIDSYNSQYYQDVLIVRYTVKNSSGVILQSTKDINFATMIEKDLIRSRGTRMGMVVLSYKGTNCGVGHGTIYLKKLNNTQMSWRYYAETTETYGGKCPPNVDKTIYLPEGENLIFNKL